MLCAVGFILAGCTTVTVQPTQVTQVAAVQGGPKSAAVVMAAQPPIATGELVPIDQWNVNLVTARNVVRLGEVREIADAFTYEGRIYAHTTLTSKPGTQAGQQQFEVMWFSGDRLVSTQKASYTVGKTPFYLASSTSGTALGAGPGRVEVHAGGKLLAAKAFTVTDR